MGQPKTTHLKLVFLTQPVRPGTCRCLFLFLFLFFSLSPFLGSLTLLLKSLELAIHCLLDVLLPLCSNAEYIKFNEPPHHLRQTHKARESTHIPKESNYWEGKKEREIFVIGYDDVIGSQETDSDATSLGSSSMVGCPCSCDILRAEPIEGLLPGWRVNHKLLPSLPTTFSAPWPRRPTPPLFSDGLPLLLLCFERVLSLVPFLAVNFLCCFLIK